MPSYDEERSSIHTELEQAAKESQEKAVERYNELQANVAGDGSGEAFGYSGKVVTDPEIRENIAALGEDPNATGAFLSPRQSGTDEWQVDESKIGGEGGGSAPPAQAKRSSRKASTESSESS